MALEFTASRLIIPVFGSSIFTWGSLIGVILAGLSLGYYAGGRLADKPNADFIKFCSIIFSAGLYIVFIPSLISPAVIGISTFIGSSSIPVDTISSNNSNSNYYGPYVCLLATFLLLITPTFLLGIVSPYAVKLTTKTLSRLGNMAGNLYSLSTIGSIVGTFLTVFFLIPTFELKYVIYGLGLSLIICSAFSYFSFKRTYSRALLITPKVLAGCSILFLILINTFLASNSIPYYTGTLVYQKETPYSHLDVVDTIDNSERQMLLDGTVHSNMNKTNQNALMYYTEFFPLGLVFNPNAKDILFAGGGGFTGPKYFLNSVPDMNVDVVEIDPVVIEAAKTHFYVPEDNPRLKIFNYDARDFLTKTSDSKYDIIVLDAYSKNYVPFHLMTLQYYELLYKKMQPNGVVISNQIGTPDGEATSDLYRAVYKTMRQVFPNVYILPIAPEVADELQNIILVATKSKTLHSNQDIRAMQQNYEDRIERSDSTSDELSGRIEFANFISDIRNINLDDVPIITDQLAPVEMLLNPITSEPYNVGAEVPTNQRVDPFSIQGNAITFVLPFVLVTLWGIYMRYIWRKEQMVRES